MEICRDKNISDELMIKRKNLLDNNMNVVIQECKHFASKLLNEKKNKSSRAGGNEEINRELKKPNNMIVFYMVFVCFF